MIRFRLFGTPELRNGKGIDLHSVLAHSKHIGLLAYLLIANRGMHRRERLTALLWPDLNDVRARNALSKALHHLRHALGDDIFLIEGNDSLGANPAAFWCDVNAFESLTAEGKHVEALDLYRRGEVLAEFSLADSPDFEQWLEQQQVRLQRQALASATALAQESEHNRDFVVAAEWARLACEISPHDESALQRHLRLLNLGSNRTGALSAYHDFSARIARDLDAVPTDATRAFVESVRNGPESATVPTVALAPPDSAPPVGPKGFPRSVRTRRWIAAAALFLIGGAGVWTYLNRSREHPRLVAVGLLRNRTGDAGLNPLAAMATGSIVEQLTQSGDVDVVDLRGMAQPGSSGQNALPLASGQTRLLAKNLGAQKVVTGDMYSKGDSLLVEMQIVSARDGRVLHQLDPVVTSLSNSYLILDRLREGVTGAIAALADTLYLPWSTAHSRPPRLIAFQEFMEGLDALVHDGPVNAVAHLKKAVALDTGFVEAKIWLMEQASMLPEERSYVDSISVAAAAQRERLGPFDQISLDRELAFLGGHWEGVYDAARRLVAVAPSTPDAQVYLAQAAMATRRYAEAIVVLHGIDPTKGWQKDLSQLWSWDLQAHRLMGDAGGGLDEWTRLRTKSPTDYGVCNAGVALYAALGREQDVDALVKQCSTLRNAPPIPDRALEVAGRVYRNRGYREPARRAFERAIALRTLAARNDARRLRGVAMLDCELGRWQLAYDNLRANADTSSFDDRSVLGVVAAHLGDTATVNSSLRWIDRWRLREPAHGQDKMARAFIALATGEREEPLRLLREAIGEGAAPAWNAWYIRFELQPLRGEPRFEELIAPRS